MSDNPRLRKRFQDVSVANTFLAADDFTTNGQDICASKTGHTIYVQKIVVNTSTDNAATLTFQDNTSTPVVIAKTKASPGLGSQVVLDSDEGIPLTEAKNLDVVASAAGLAGSYSVTAYLKQTANLDLS